MVFVKNKQKNNLKGENYFISQLNFNTRPPIANTNHHITHQGGYHKYSRVFLHETGISAMDQVYLKYEKLPGEFPYPKLISLMSSKNESPKKDEAHLGHTIYINS
jgi:hypothetical protein